MSRYEALPLAFIRTLSEQQLLAILRNDGWLSLPQTITAWRYMGSKGPEPTKPMRLMFSWEEIMKVWPPKARSASLTACPAAPG